MVGRELRVDFVVCAPEVDHSVTVVAGRQLLLDDIRLNGYTQVVGLSGKVCRFMLIDITLFENRIAQVTP